MIRFYYLPVLLFIVFSSPSQGQFLDRKAEGWHFYEELRRGENKPPEKVMAASPKATQPDPIDQLEKYKKKIEWLKARAIMKPTFEHVQSYMEAQKEVMERGTLFARKWLEVVYTTPNLDYSIQHPTSQVGRHVYLDQKQERMERQIKRLSQSHGLFFFFSRSCPYCRSFAPIVKAFSQKYGWEIMAISVDGSTLPEFPEAIRDNGLSRKLGLEALPALLAVNPKAESIIPLSYGLSSQDQILDRIRVLIIERNGP